MTPIHNPVRFRSDFLFQRPSFLTGAARLFDFWGLFSSYNYSRNPEEVDAHVGLADWGTVGQDIWDAIQQFEEQLDSPKERDHPQQKELFDRAL